MKRQPMDGRKYLKILCPISASFPKYTVNIYNSTTTKKPQTTPIEKWAEYLSSRRQYWRFLKKQGIKPPYDPAISFLVTYPEETKIEKRHVYSVVHFRTIYNSYNMEAI